MRRLLLVVLLFGCASVPAAQKTTVPPVAGCPDGVTCPQMKCAPYGGTVEEPQVFVSCYVVNAGSTPEWRLYGHSKDALMFFSEGHFIQMEVPNEWHLFEMRAQSSDGEVRVAQLLIRAVGGKLEHKAP